MAKTKRDARGRAGSWTGSLFRGTDGGSRVQGVLTPVGSACFETARQRLAALASNVRGEKVAAARVSDANTIEYLARGEEQTRHYLEGQQRTQ